MVLDITKPHIWVVNHGYIYITQCNFFFVFYDFDKTSIENKKSNGQMRATVSGLLQRELR